MAAEDKKPRKALLIVFTSIAIAFILLELSLYIIATLYGEDNAQTLTIIVTTIAIGIPIFTLGKYGHHFM